MTTRREFIRLLGAGAAALAVPGIWIEHAASERIAVYALRRSTGYDTTFKLPSYAVDLLGGVVENGEAVLDHWQEGYGIGEPFWEDAERVVLNEFKKHKANSCRLVRINPPKGWISTETLLERISVSVAAPA